MGNIDERFTEARERIKERIDELDGEIRRVAVQSAFEARLPGFVQRFSGGGRRVLTDRILERLATQEVLDAVDDAIAEATAEEQKRLEYEERVLKPQREAAARELEAKRKREEYDSRVALAIASVKQSIQRSERPAGEDVVLLRRNTTYASRYVAPGDVEQLLWRHDHNPWWPAEDRRRSAT